MTVVQSGPYAAAIVDKMIEDIRSELFTMYGAANEMGYTFDTSEAPIVRLPEEPTMATCPSFPPQTTTTGKIMI